MVFGIASLFVPACTEPFSACMPDDNCPQAGSAGQPERGGSDAHGGGGRGGAGAGGELAAPESAGAPASPHDGEGGVGTISRGGQVGVGGDEGVSGAGGDADVTPPRVISTFPKDGSTAVHALSAIEVQFSETMDELALTRSSFVVHGLTGPISGTLSYSNRVAKFVPDGPLSLLGKYTVLLTAELHDLNGNALADAPQQWSFQMADGVWQEPELVVDGLQTALELANNASGEAVVLWRAERSLAVRFMDREGVLGGPRVLELDSEPLGPSIGMLPDGDALVVWRIPEHILASRCNPRTGWSEPVRLESQVLIPASDLSLAVDRNGNATAIWNEGNNSQWRYFTSRFEPSLGWQPATPLESVSPGHLGGAPAIAMAEGKAVAAWTRIEPDGSNVIVVRRTSDGQTWTDPVILDKVSSVERFTSGPVVLMDSSGLALAIWSVHRSDDTAEARFSRSTSSAAWSAWASFGEASGLPAVAINASGNALQLWSRVSDTTPLLARSFSPTRGWQSLDSIEFKGGNLQSIPFLGVDDVAMVSRLGARGTFRKHHTLWWRAGTLRRSRTHNGHRRLR